MISSGSKIRFQSSFISKGFPNCIALLQASEKTPSVSLKITAPSTFNLNGVSIAIDNGRLLGEDITFAIGGKEYKGKVSVDARDGYDLFWESTLNKIKK